MSKLEAELIVAGVDTERVSDSIVELERMGRLVREGWDGEHDGHHDHSMLAWLHEKAERAAEAAAQLVSAVEQARPDFRQG